MWYRRFTRRNFGTVSVTLLYARWTPTVCRRDTRQTQMRRGCSDRLYLSSTVCATKYRLKCRCYTWASLHETSTCTCFKVRNIRFSQTNYVSNNYKSNVFRNKINPIFLRGKIYRSWMTGKRWYLPVKLYNFAGKWPVTSINFETC